VGYGIAKPEIIEYFNRIRLPFNVTTVAQAAAMASLDDPDQVKRSKEVNEEGMKYLTRELERLGMGVTESYTNFLLVDLKRDGVEVCRRLEEMGLIVRPMKAFRLPEQYVRITVGLPYENERLIEGLGQICASGVGGPKA
jgi:histidinol-phosphate aminotransferase